MATTEKSTAVVRAENAEEQAKQDLDKANSNLSDAQKEYTDAQSIYSVKSKNVQYWQNKLNNAETALDKTNYQIALTQAKNELKAANDNKTQAQNAYMTAKQKVTSATVAYGKAKQNVITVKNQAAVNKLNAGLEDAHNTINTVNNSSNSSTSDGSSSSSGKTKVNELVTYIVDAHNEVVKQDLQDAAVKAKSGDVWGTVEASLDSLEASFESMVVLQLADKYISDGLDKYDTDAQEAILGVYLSKTVFNDSYKSAIINNISDALDSYCDSITKEYAEQLTSGLKPGFDKVTGVIDTVSGHISDLSTQIDSVTKQVSKYSVVNAFNEMVNSKGITSSIQNTLDSHGATSIIAKPMGNLVSNCFSFVSLSIAGSSFTQNIATAQNAIVQTGTMLKNVLSDIQTQFTEIKSAINSFQNQLTELAQNFMNMLLDPIKEGIMGAVKGIVNSVVDSIADSIVDSLLGDDEEDQEDATGNDDNGGNEE